MVDYCDVISGKCQNIYVNVWASPVDENAWKDVLTIVIDPGYDWYFAPLKYEDGSVSKDIYLIRDEVGSDGWGHITVYKDVKVNGRAPELSVVRLRNAPVKW